MIHILVPKKHPGKRFPQICSFKKPSFSVVSGKPNSYCNINYTFTWFIIFNQSKIILKEIDAHFSAQETPRVKIPTDSQL